MIFKIFLGATVLALWIAMFLFCIYMLGTLKGGKNEEV